MDDSVQSWRLWAITKHPNSWTCDCEAVRDVNNEGYQGPLTFKLIVSKIVHILILLSPR